MTKEEKIIKVQALLNNDEEAVDDVVSAYLSLSKAKILERLYPFDDTKRDIPHKYDMLHCELATRLFLRRGAEGEISHSENGINRTYDSVDDEDILSRIVPFAKVVF